MAIIGKDVAILFQSLWCIMLCIHQYRVHIVYKPGPNLYILDWLLQKNNMENRDEEITGMNINMQALSTSVKITIWTSIEDIQAAAE